MEKYIEKDCKYHGVTSFVLENRGYYRCKACRSEGVVKRRRNVKAKLVEAFGNKCVVCGYNRYVGALQFHHLDPTKKEFTISSPGMTWSYERLSSEAKKCVLVCANCHAEIENGITQWPVADK